MTDRPTTRRAFLAATGSTLSLAGCLGNDDDEGLTPEKTDMGTGTPVDDVHVGDQWTGAWHAVNSPTEGTLYDVAVTRHNVYAVGENGTILSRCNGLWEAIEHSNLSATSNSLYDTAVSSDDHNLWFAGSSGAVGVYNPSDQTIMDYSTPGGMTSTWESVGALGRRGEETVFLADGSGNLVRGERDGQEVDWSTGHGPGGGDAFTALTFVDGTGYLADGNGNVYRSTDGGDSWDDIGIRGVTSALLDVAPASGDTLFVSGGSGAIYRYNGMTWTQLRAGGSDVMSLSVESRTDGLACTGGGEVYTIADGRWHKLGQPVDSGLHGIVHGTETTPQVAVGGSGAIVERFPDGGD